MSLTAIKTNQVAALRKSGVNAATINSTTSQSTRQKILKDLERGHPTIDILYVTPELCTYDYFRKHLTTIYHHKELARIAIDEAHCISEWGHDFRPSFKQLHYFRKVFSDVPIMCLTATATARVREDIISTLSLNKTTLKTFTMTTARPNLHHEVRFKSDDQDHFDSFLSWLLEVYNRRKSSPERLAQLEKFGERVDAVSGIIYTLFRTDCENLASRLRNKGIGAKPYHAGLSNVEKEEHLDGWVNGKIGYDVIVATTAFGMGIDKDNVRFVCHWQLPKSFEGFYQEAGRAGRDGKASICIMVCFQIPKLRGVLLNHDEQYYSREDRDRGYYRIGQDKKNPGEQRARAASFQAVSRQQTPTRNFF